MLPSLETMKPDPTPESVSIRTTLGPALSTMSFTLISPVAVFAEFEDELWSVVSDVETALLVVVVSEPEPPPISALEPQATPPAIRRAATDERSTGLA